MSGDGGYTRVDARGRPLPTAPREGLVFEFRCRGCDCTREVTWRIRRVNSKSFYVSTWGGASERIPLGRWEAWLDARMAEGELKLVDCSPPRLELVSGGRDR